MSAEQAVKEEPREAHPEDEETVYYPDFYDPAMLCASHSFALPLPFPRSTRSLAMGSLALATLTPRAAVRSSRRA